MQTRLKQLVRAGLRPFGLELRRRRTQPQTLAWALAHAKAPVRTVIDIGASDGRWSERVMQHYPDASYVLVEAQQQTHGPALEAFAKRHPRVEVVFAAAGDRDGTLMFDADSPFGGAVIENDSTANATEVASLTLDTIVSGRRLEPPFFVKLDTHGFEVPIFEGARATLRDTSAILVEVYNFQLRDDPACLRFPALCQYLEAKGFRCYDLIDVMHRPSDHALWQMDLLFLPASRPEFSRNQYR